MTDDLLSALITGLDDEDQARTVELIARGMEDDLNAVGGQARRRVDYGTRQRRSGVDHHRGGATARQPGADPSGADRPGADPSGGPRTDVPRERG
jgi:hypothetical protein